MGPHALSVRSPMSNPVTDIEALVMDEQSQANLPALQQLLKDMEGFKEWKVSEAACAR